MQEDSAICKISAKYSFEVIIVKEELNLVDFQVRHRFFCINGSTAAVNWYMDHSMSNRSKKKTSTVFDVAQICHTRYS